MDSARSNVNVNSHSLMPPESNFPVIVPLLRRHSEDAAFYWSQIDNSAHSSSTNFSRLSLFDKLLRTHLEGLRVSGAAGRGLALNALERWRKAGEVYVCAKLALEHGCDELLHKVLGIVKQRPDEQLRGLISAVARTETSTALTLIRSWTALSAEPIAQVVALRALALIGPAASGAMSESIVVYVSSPSPFVRASACRACAREIYNDVIIAALRSALSDTDIAVRAEAAIALGQFGILDEVTPILIDCVVLQAAMQVDLSGWNRKQSSRRLSRWVRHLGWLLPIGSELNTVVLNALEPQEALTFALWHGDLSNLKVIIDHVGNPAVSAYAGWVWQTLTGIDLSATGLAAPGTPLPLLAGDATVSSEQFDAVNGFVQPNADAIRALTVGNTRFIGSANRCVLGHELNLGRAAHLLAHAPQAIRLIAAQFVNELNSTGFIGVRSESTQQRDEMAAIDELIAVD